MRLSIRHASLLFGAYLVGVAGLFYATERWLYRAAWEQMEETAMMVGQEIASAMARPLIEQLDGERDPNRIADSLDGLARRSPVVRDVTLVDAAGRAVAGTSPATPSADLASVAELFGEDARPRLTGLEGPDLASGRFVLEVPLIDAGVPRAYLRLSLGSSRLAALYTDGRRALLIAAGLGLLATFGLGYLLHLQLSRREHVVVSALGRALTGESVPSPAGDAGLRELLAAADRLGGALRAERSRSGLAERGLAEIGQLLEVGVLVVDESGGLEIAGRQAISLLGLQGGAEGGENPRQWATVRERLAPALEEARATGARTIRNVDVPGPDGELRSLRCQLQPLSEGRCLVAVRDRRLLQALEADLREAARSRGLARLYLGAAHDLKAPLNAITLNLELLRQSLGEEQTEEASEGRLEILRVVGEELARLRRSLEGLLDQTAPAARSHEQIDLRHLLSEVKRLLDAQARQQRVEIEAGLPEERLDVYCQPDAVKQALLNVAINALDAMPNGGRLSLSAGRDHHLVRVRLADSGPGIPEDVREQVFDLHVTTKATGTGIGLYVARSILEAEGGGLEVASTGPEGTAFELRLPAARQEAA